MNTINQTETFSKWLNSLRDGLARAKIAARINRAKAGNFGDVKSVGDSVSEMRVDHGPGYRVYFIKTGTTIYLLLAGGDKATQPNDIKKAKELARSLS